VFLVKRLSLPLDVEPVLVADKLVRGWRCVLEYSELCRPPPNDQLFTTYDTALRDVADHLASLHSVRRQRSRLSPWFDAECRWARRDSSTGTWYRRTRSLADRRLWVEATRRLFHLHRRKKDEYWRQRLERCGRLSALLWRSLSSLLGRDRDLSSATDHTADGFAVFFCAQGRHCSCRHSWSVAMCLVPRRHCRVSGSALRKKYVGCS